MKQILIIILILCLVGCNGQTKNENSFDNKPNNIVLKFNNTSVAFEKVSTVNDANNIQDDFIIKKNGAKILIQPSYLESDLLDGKTLKFSNDAVSIVKVTFNYDAIFYGEEKKNVALGFNRDTTMILKVNNREIKIPNFENIKRTLKKNFERK